MELAVAFAKSEDGQRREPALSRIFLSHSSTDKPFVRRIASDLLAEGFPVWFDEWNMEMGDSLVDEIYEGVEGSRIIILCVSSHSSASDWVGKELNAALTRERQTKQKILIPIKLDGTEAPLKVADRIYADFSKSYQKAFQSLCAVLRKHKLEPETDPTNYRFALSFLKDIDLNNGQFLGQLKQARRVFSKEAPIQPDNLVIIDSEKCAALRNKAFERYDNIESDTFYSAEFAVTFQGYFQQIIAMDLQMKQGICYILNNYMFGGDSRLVEPVMATRPFCRIFRSAILGMLYNMQSPADPDKIASEPGWLPYLSGSEASHYGLETMGKLDVGHSSDGLGLWDTVGVWVGRDEALFKDTSVHGHMVLNRLRDYDAATISQFVLPQLVLHMLRGGQDELSIPLESMWVGRG